MFNILVNWKELTAYNTSEESKKAPFKTRHKAKLLKEMLLDYKNYLYFQFATPIVQE